MRGTRHEQRSVYDYNSNSTLINDILPPGSVAAPGDVERSVLSHQYPIAINTTSDQSGASSDIQPLACISRRVFA